MELDFQLCPLKYSALLVLWCCGAKPQTNLHMCAQLLRLLEFMEHDRATEIKCSHWDSYICIQNYSQCWEMLGEEKRTEMLGS